MIHTVVAGIVVAGECVTIVVLVVIALIVVFAGIVVKIVCLARLALLEDIEASVPCLEVCGEGRTVVATVSRNDFDGVHVSSHYRPSFVNPALKNPMYHKTAQSVLENLSSFKALYVKYENCAWAYYGNEYAEKNNNGGWDGGGEAAQFRGCGALDGGDDYWYMGRMACFRAQAAYSLCGIPTDGSRSGNKKCHKATYINSFFTTMGVETFATPLGVDTTYGNGYCTAFPPNYGGGDGDNNWAISSYTSTGTGCQRKKFVTDSYWGANCNGDNYVETTDTLDNFNQALHQLECVQIYDSSMGYMYDEDGQDQGDNNDIDDFTELSTLDILRYSVACDVNQYPDSCPDPYRLLHKYSKALQSALAKTDVTVTSKSAGEKALNAFTGIFFFAAALFAWSTYQKRRRMYSTKAKWTPPPKSKEATVELANVNTSESAAPATTEPKPNSWEKPAPWECYREKPAPSAKQMPEDVIVVEKEGEVVATVDAATGAATPTTAE